MSLLWALRRICIRSTIRVFIKKDCAPVESILFASKNIVFPPQVLLASISTLPRGLVIVILPMPRSRHMHHHGHTRVVIVPGTLVVRRRPIGCKHRCAPPLRPRSCRPRHPRFRGPHHHPQHFFHINLDKANALVLISGSGRPGGANERRIDGGVVFGVAFVFYLISAECSYRSGLTCRSERAIAPRCWRQWGHSIAEWHKKLFPL